MFGLEAEFDAMPVWRPMARARTMWIKGRRSGMGSIGVAARIQAHDLSRREVGFDFREFVGAGGGLAVDGVFGLGTLAAVEDLQRWFGLKVDGIVGPMTWKLLYG